MTGNQIEIFSTSNGKIQVEVQFEGDTFWFSPNDIDLYSTIAKNATVQQESNC
jgi:hypothetical protein